MSEAKPPDRSLTLPRGRLGAAWKLKRAVTLGELAAVLRLSRKSGADTVRTWERRGGMSGPAQVAVDLMLAGAGSAALIAWDGARMSGEALRDARRVIGDAWGCGRPLSEAELAIALRLDPIDGPGIIAGYEAGEGAISGPISLAVDLMLTGQRPPHLAGLLPAPISAAARPARADEFPGAVRSARPLTGRGGKTPATVT